MQRASMLSNDEEALTVRGVAPCDTSDAAKLAPVMVVQEEEEQGVEEEDLRKKAEAWCTQRSQVTGKGAWAELGRLIDEEPRNVRRWKDGKPEGQWVRRGVEQKMRAFFTAIGDELEEGEPDETPRPSQKRRRDAELQDRQLETPEESEVVQAMRGELTALAAAKDWKGAKGGFRNSELVAAAVELGVAFIEAEHYGSDPMALVERSIACAIQIEQAEITRISEFAQYFEPGMKAATTWDEILQRMDLRRRFEYASEGSQLPVPLQKLWTACYCVRRSQLLLTLTPAIPDVCPCGCDSGASWLALSSRRPSQHFRSFAFQCSASPATAFTSTPSWESCWRTCSTARVPLATASRRPRWTASCRRGIWTFVSTGGRESRMSCCSTHSTRPVAAVLKAPSSPRREIIGEQQGPPTTEEQGPALISMAAKSLVCKRRSRLAT